MHERALQHVAFRVAGSREGAADIAPETFLRVFAGLDARPSVLTSTCRRICSAPLAILSTTTAGAQGARRVRVT